MYFLKIILSIIKILIGLGIVCSVNVYSNNTNYKQLKSHLTQLENVINAHSECLTHFQEQLTSIEQEVSILRGQIQDNEHQLLKIIERQQHIIQTINSFKNKKNNITNHDINDDIISDVKNINNILSSYDNTQDNLDYHQAVSLVLEKKQYEKAIQLFQKFIFKYPNSIYQSNAHYWLGQLYYRKGNKHDASYHFALVAKKYPKSSKAPDSLLKVGIIMQENGNNEKARFIYNKINHLYPNSDAAKQIQKRLINR